MSDISTRTTKATRVRHLDQLAVVLRQRGLTVEHLTIKVDTPGLRVTNPAVPGGMLAERVLCCLDGDGSAGLYFSWGVRHEALFSRMEVKGLHPQFLAGNC